MVKDRKIRISRIVSLFMIVGLLASLCTAVVACQLDQRSMSENSGMLYIVYKSDDESITITAEHLVNNYNINVIEEYNSFYLVRASVTQIQMLRDREIFSYPLLKNNIEFLFNEVFLTSPTK